jgi:LysR family hydrogen peroxide-inducible transcriptional activator
VTPALHAHYPRLTVVWVEDKTAVLSASLSEGSLDAAVLALEADLGDFEHAVIATDPFVLAASPDDPLAKKKAPARLEELEGERVLLLDDGHCFREQALAVCSRAGARELEVRATSLPTLSQMVARGLGVTLLPKLAVETEAGRAGLAVRPFAEPAPRRTIALVWRRGSPWTATFRKVAGTLAEAYPGRRARRSGPGRRNRAGTSPAPTP